MRQVAIYRTDERDLTFQNDQVLAIIFTASMIPLYMTLGYLAKKI